MEVNYPPSPKSVPPGLTKVSAAYKKGVRQSLWSLVVFFVLYAGLITLNVFAIIWAVELNMHSYLPGLIGVFVILLLLVILGLQLNFLFQDKKKEDSPEVEITREEQPELFSFIEKLCVEIGAPFPGKIVVSGRNNASVFQPVGFWRLIIPPKKNLEIGLPLALSIDLTEFKAILAHEMGHFSQSSTRVGGYVYSVNEVIGRMVFSRELWEGSISQFARMNMVFYAIANLAYQFGRGQRKLFIAVYKYVNKSYMRLSREMEFHADSVAISVSGSSSIISGLRRIQFAESSISSFDYYLAKYRETDKKDPENYFLLYQKFSRTFAIHNKFDLTANGHVIIDKEKMGGFSSKRKLVYENLWQSHPSLEEREKSAAKSSIESVVDDTPAISIFRNCEKLSKIVSEKLRVQLKAQTKQAFQIIDTSVCEVRLLEIFCKESIPDRFQEVYDIRIIPALEFSELSYRNFSITDFVSVAGVELKEQALYLKALHHDLTEITAIGTKQLDVNVFEYDNVNYSWKKAPELIVELQAKLDECLESLKQKDEEIFLFHYTHAQKLRQPLDKELLSICSAHKQVSHLFTDLTEVYNLLLPSIEDIHRRGNLLRSEQAEFIVPYGKAIELFRLAVEKAKHGSCPASIGNIQLPGGILAYVWEGELPDFSFRAFRFEMLMEFWEKLIKALHKVSAARLESHFGIINLYEKIYNDDKQNKTDG